VVNRSQHAPGHIELLDFAKDIVAAYPNEASLNNSAHIDALMENLQSNLRSPGNQHAKPFVWTKAEVYRFCCRPLVDPRRRRVRPCTFSARRYEAKGLGGIK
jgi:hypothetical protein